MGRRVVAPRLRARGVTAREAEVLEALAERLTNAEIAARLSISVRTVETHVSSLMAKLDTGDRVTLAAAGRASQAHRLAELRLPRPPEALVGSAVPRTPFVGREPEQALLCAALAGAQRGAGGIVLIGGEPGIGKTRLAEEVAATATRAGTTVLSGHSYEAEGASSYVAFSEILEAALAFSADHQTFLRDILGDAAAEVARVLPRLRRLFPDLPPPLDLPAEQQRRYLFTCLADVFARVSAATPTLLVLDDLQWADEASLQLLEHLAPKVASWPMLIVATYRDAEVGPHLARTFSDLHRRRLAQRVMLTGLAQDETTELIAGMAGQTPPAAVCATLQAATDGNAFFLEEVIRDLMAQGRLNEAGDLGNLDVPEGALLVTSRRLDRLTAQTRALLCSAAVAGRVFSFRLLQALSGLPSGPLLDTVDEAMRAALIREREVVDEFFFAHELIRASLVADLTGPRRRQAHLASAHALAKVWAGDLDTHAAEIAHHLLAAGPAADPAEAFAYCLRAGRQAVATSSYAEAYDHLHRAAELRASAPPDQLAGLYAALARAHQALGRHQEAPLWWQRALDAAEACADLDSLGRMAVDGGKTLVYAGRTVESQAMYRRGLAALGDAARADRARLLSGLAMVLILFGDDPAGGTECHELARAVAATLDDELTSRYVDTDWAQVANALMLSAHSAAAGLRAIPVLHAAGDLWAMCDAWWMASWSAWACGDYASSLEMEEHGLAIARRIGHAMASWGGLRSRCGREFVRTGDLVAFEADAEQDIALCTELLGGAWNAWGYTALGLRWFLTGDVDQAEQWFAKGAATVPTGGYAGWAWGGHLLFLARTGSPAAARELLARYAHAFPVSDAPVSTGGWGILLAATEAWWVLGDRERAAAGYPMLLRAITETGTLMGGFAPYQLLERVAGIAAGAAGD